MSATRRIEKLSMFIREEVSKIIERDYDFLDVLVTITKVTISPDKNYAVVHLSILGKEPRLSLHTLQKNIYTIQQALNKRLRVRPVPRIRFVIDKEEFRREKVEKSLASLKRNNGI